MHAALCIDEIFEIVLEACSHWTEKEYCWTLAQLARCCRLWYDPAEDRLWCRLDSLRPLLSLLPGFGVKNGVVEFMSPENVTAAAFARLHSHAARVRSIKHTESISMPPSLHPFIFLPNLRSVRFSQAGCETSACWSISRAVCKVDINLGFSPRPDSADTDKAVQRRSSAVADYLDELFMTAKGVHSLRMRGSVSVHLDQKLATYTSLRSLDLHMGICLSAETFATISAAFPHLSELDINAQHIDAIDFRMALPCSVSQLFPSLQHLTIRAEPALLVALLPLVPPDVMRSIHLDADCPLGVSSLHDVCELLSARVSGSLQEFAIQHFPDFDEIDDPESARETSDWFTIAILRPLARLQFLRRFSVAATKPPDLCDKDIEEIASWWPHLEHLDLGTLDDEDCSRRMTTCSYAALARSCPMLRSLALPVEIPDITSSSSIILPVPANTAERPRPVAFSQQALRYVRIGRLPPTAGSASSFRTFIRLLFPSLVTMDVSAPADTATGNLDKLHASDSGADLAKYYVDILDKYRDY
ncbi:uncharacterized protein LAESUDRAFT_758689 [Laetiporus sulphureus 93-53]|uniref:F-box domain-containing protein n=1 Tax=Laetiporus sulphureus 93-53 TaxID=1314785 RepID=A0A165EL35_9APHY|nr:uncharacterized protein LAESUDRAFT_758689 [Laetiporus sulphureus 93-53]KZT07282.1 hypothetical protein LAESUDRAFT_758689 [Laetiporus sulphureus 93-53]